jgi:hypothetical protein
LAVHQYEVVLHARQCLDRFGASAPGDVAMRELGFDPSHVIGFFIERGKLTRGMPTVIKDSSYFDLLFSRHPIACERKTE